MKINDERIVALLHLSVAKNWLSPCHECHQIICKSYAIYEMKEPKVKRETNLVEGNLGGGGKL